MSSSSLPPTPSLMVGAIHHRRREAVEHAFSHRFFTWLIDVDAPPRWGVWTSLFARYVATDFVQGNSPDGPFGQQVRRELAAVVAEYGYRLERTDRLLMAAHPRQLGYTFNPLTMWWCYTPSGQLRWTVAEVHNTYGSRHLYVLGGGPQATVCKRMYVSPFHDVSGNYHISHHLTAKKLEVTVTLEREGAPPYRAAMLGELIPATPRSLLVTMARHPLMTWQVAVLIRVHGIFLWLRRLRVHERPPRRPPTSSAEHEQTLDKDV